MTNDPIRQADIERRLANLAKAPPLRCQNEDRFAVPASSCKRAGAMSDARRSERIGRAARFSERQLQAWILDYREQACTQRNRRQSSRA